MTDPAHPDGDADADGRIGWEDPPRRAACTAVPLLSVDGFEGPLDFLLEMARARKIDLALLSIVALVEAFADALGAALTRLGGTADLARWGDWLVMTANLTLLRSRLLLPADAAEARAAREEAEALRLTLLGREEMRAAANWLERRVQLGRDVFPRGQAEAPAHHRRGDVTELLRACLAMLRVPAAAQAYQLRVLPFWRVPDAMARIGQMMEASEAEVAMAALLPAIAADAVGRDRLCRAAVASTLVASLELCRSGLLEVTQSGAWTPITVARANTQTRDG